MSDTQRQHLINCIETTNKRLQTATINQQKTLIDQLKTELEIYRERLNGK